MQAKEILAHLETNQAVLTGSHFAYSAGGHGTGYVNMRNVAHQGRWLKEVGLDMSRRIANAIGMKGSDIVLGPESLGRTLAGYTALGLHSGQYLWCDMVGSGEDKKAVFSPKFERFPGLVDGKRVVIVDDLLTSGSSIRLAAELVTRCGGTPIMGVAVVRRTPGIVAENCGVPQLDVLADIEGFETFSQEECSSHGPCFHRVPMVLRPGHGHIWIEDHPGYPVA